MKTELQKIETLDTNLKTEFQTLNDRYLVAIYDGLIHKKTANQIHKKLYDLTINSQTMSEGAYKKAISGVDRIKKRLPNDESVLKVAQLKYPRYKIDDKVDALAILVFDLFKMIKLPESIGKEFNKTRNEIEGEEKDEVIRDSLDNNRKRHIVYYLSSEHKDCAKDHLDYQGKIYIDENWESHVSEEEKSEIRFYNAEHNIMTLQEVTHRPVWLITRPHCRHYFKEIATDEVLGNSVKTLIKKYDMKKTIGRRRYLQTLDSGVGTYTRKLLGEKRNAELMIEKYQIRLETYQKLYKIRKTPILKDAMTKTRFLIAKWKKYYSEL